MTVICTCVVFVSDTKDGVRGSLVYVFTGVLPGSRPIHIYLIDFLRFCTSRRAWSPVLDRYDKCNVLDAHVLLHTSGTSQQEIIVAYVSSRCASYGRICGIKVVRSVCALGKVRVMLGRQACGPNDNRTICVNLQAL